MPKQETYFEHVTGDRRIEVVKTYDQMYAREAFDSMDESAQGQLWKSLSIEENFSPSDIPSIQSPESGEFLWEELLDAAREDGNIISFFVVNETSRAASKSLYVSPDWPSAEAFTKRLIAKNQ